MRKAILLTILLLLMVEAASASMIESGQKFAVALTIVSILISFPAFISLYIHIRKTNLGKVLLQPLLAMFAGFIGMTLNSLIQIWRVFIGYEVSNRDLLMGINSALSTILIAIGAVMMFFAVRKKGLLPIEYYRKDNIELDEKDRAALMAALKEIKPALLKESDTLPGRTPTQAPPADEKGAPSRVRKSPKRKR